MRSPHQYDISIHTEIIIYQANCQYINVDNDDVCSIDVYRLQRCPYYTKFCLGELSCPSQKIKETKNQKVTQDTENRASFFHLFKKIILIYNIEMRIELCELDDRLIEEKIS